MKGYIKGKSILLKDSLPLGFNEGEEVEVIVMPVKKTYNFPTFKLGIKDESLRRERIYEGS